ncbi:MAG: hypothetical protein AB8B74_03205 [Crocinitomicaceae bacterium]
MKQFLNFTIICILTISVISCNKQIDYEVSFSSQANIINGTYDMKIQANIQSDIVLETHGLLFLLDTSVWIHSYYPESYDGGPVAGGKIIDETNSQNRSYTLANLSPASTYYYRLFTVNRGLVKYSQLMSFTTGCGGLGCGPAGGRIIYLDNNGGGIEVAADFVTEPGNWGCQGNFINTTNDEIGTGQANTNQIMSECESNTLAKVCDDYEQNGYADYYMPSIAELELIYSEVFIKEQNLYGWQNTVYYSSSEHNESSCKAIEFSLGSMWSASYKNVGYRTIPVRSF